MDVAGGALVGDNLGTALTAAGEDARYANLLFLLLGLPGLALAAPGRRLVVSLRSDRRRREIALLRLRGAIGLAQVARLVAGEALVTAAVGALIGLPLALLAMRLALPAGAPLPTAWAVTAVGAAACSSPWRRRRDRCSASRSAATPNAGRKAWR